MKFFLTLVNASIKVNSQHAKVFEWFFVRVAGKNWQRQTHFQHTTEALSFNVDQKGREKWRDFFVQFFPPVSLSCFCDESCFHQIALHICSLWFLKFGNLIVGGVGCT